MKIVEKKVCVISRSAMLIFLEHACKAFRGNPRYVDALDFACTLIDSIEDGFEFRVPSFEKYKDGKEKR